MTVPIRGTAEGVTPTNNHVYVRTHRIFGQSLRFRLSDRDLALGERATSSKTGRAGKTLVKEGALRITEVALRTGSHLGSHQIGGAVSMQVLRGRLRLMTTDGEVWLERGELIALDAGVAHAGEAMSDCVILITMAMQHTETEAWEKFRLSRPKQADHWRADARRPHARRYNEDPEGGE